MTITLVRHVVVLFYYHLLHFSFPETSIQGGNWQYVKRTAFINYWSTNIGVVCLFSKTGRIVVFKCIHKQKRRTEGSSLLR